MELEALNCTITKTVRQRILLGKDKLEAIFTVIEKIYHESLNLCEEKERGYLSERKPEVSIRLTDGSSYKFYKLSDVFKIITKKERLVEKIEIETLQGNIRCSLEISQGYYGPATLTVKGPEHKSRHYSDLILDILKQESDITSYIYRLKPGWVFLSYFTFSLLASAYYYKYHPKDVTWPVALLPILLLVVCHIYERFHEKFLPQVAFDWGEDRARHQIAKNVCIFFLGTIPLLILGALFSEAIG